LRAIK
jgi:hypothetical protein